MSETSDSKFEGYRLACVRGERVVFTELSFALGPGEALVLRGPNGSGKSSLLRLAAALSPPVAGGIAWNGESVSGQSVDAHKARLVYVGHQDAVKPVLTVAENIAFWTGLAGAPAGAAQRALAELGLEGLAGTPARVLSAGQRRRLNLARLFAAPTDLWLLDEPATGLDRGSVDALETAIDYHRREGGMVMMATHTDIWLADTQELELSDFAAGVDEAEGVLGL